MEVSEKSTGKVSAEITVKIGKADYQESVDKALRSYAQKASIPGFRKGKAPKAMIQKMVGKSILIDEINKSNATEEEKKNALSKLQELIYNPLICNILSSGVVESIKVALGV